MRAGGVVISGISRETGTREAMGLSKAGQPQERSHEEMNMTAPNTPAKVV